MTDKQEFQLVIPLIGGAGFFLMSLLIGRATGDLNRYTWKGLLAAGGLVAYAVYLMAWQNEIRALWLFSPMLVVFALLLSLIIPTGLFAWIWHVQTAAKSDAAGVLQGQSVGVTRPVTTFQKILRRVVLVWGLINLVGLLAMIIHSYLFRKP